MNLAAIVQQQTGRSMSAGPIIIGPALHTLKLLQVWQWEGRTLDEAIGMCRQYGFTGLLVKALDGTSWMNQFDPARDALGSIEELQVQADVCHLAGLYHFAWTNPLQAGSLSEQAKTTAAIARTCDGVFLDVEPYAQFWGANAPAGLASSFMQTIRTLAPDAFIALQPDPRPTALQSIRVTEWLPFCDALAGQHYWSDFGSQPNMELAYAYQLSLQYGVPILPTLPGNAPLSGFPLELIDQLPGFVVWRMGTTPNNTLAALGAREVAGLPTEKIRGQL